MTRSAREAIADYMINIYRETYHSELGDADAILACLRKQGHVVVPRGVAEHFVACSEDYQTVAEVRAALQQKDTP